jgi:disease resistance protein
MEKKCLRPGCGKKYTEENNTEISCNYHDGNPIFHDIKKGWTCCNKLVYDWDEFQKLVGCKSGMHSDIKQESQFFKSNTVANAQAGLDRQNNTQQMSMPTKVVPKTIEEHEKEQKLKDEEKKKAEMDKPKVLIVF